MNPSLQELISATSELHSLPSTTFQLMRLLDDATVGADEVLSVIEKDPSLTSNLLKLSNSAYYGLRRQVGTVREALVLLGNQTIVSLAFATSMGDILRGPLTAYRLRRNDLWRHALGTGLGAAHLVSLGPDSSLRERAFTGGLVHDIGKLILNRPLKEHLQTLPPDADSSALLGAEFDILGFDHAQAGAALAEAWNFPDSLVRIISCHHQPEVIGDDDQTRELTRAVAAANLLTSHLGFGGGTGPVPEQELQLGLEDLGYSGEVVDELRTRLPAEVESMLGLQGDVS